MSMLVEPGVRGGNDLGEFPLCRPVLALRVDLEKGGAAGRAAELSGRRVAVGGRVGERWGLSMWHSMWDSGFDCPSCDLCLAA